MAALQVNGSTYPPLCYLFRKINTLFTDLLNKIWMEASGFDLQYLLTVEYERLRYEPHRSRNENKTQRTTTELVAVVRTPSFQLYVRGIVLNLTWLPPKYYIFMWKTYYSYDTTI